MARFTVDTHLFRELGELLVGRDSTALIELIKNAYDADATEVTVHGELLDTPGQGRILVVDDGDGMDAAEFELGFLRVASRLKEEGERRSTRFHRRYTGAKGIGRLAAHKLARKLEVTSRRRVSPGTRMQPQSVCVNRLGRNRIPRDPGRPRPRGGNPPRTQEIECHRQLRNDTRALETETRLDSD